ncbi:MAG: 50S ribosome-binding GTPase [Candidatus Poseidonia sp.]|nr:50S ribosome-binding GTPase [Poseidonia sp.]
MAQPPEDPFVVAGSGGVVLGEARTNHEGRRALLLVRGLEDTNELRALAITMGITIVETVVQSGHSDPRTYFGKGRLEDIADEQKSTMTGHPWEAVDLVIIHTNATPRQLVGVSQALGVEVWDRVRLLLALFTAHASSVEARTQVRIAQLQSDRTILRELANQQTTGERAGYGGGGITALQGVLANLNRELTNLRRRQKKQANAQREHRRQRRRSGAMTVGFVGYTNAGKSSLFQHLSGKKVLVEDQLFSTLETTVGRMEKSPRILLADTIGFIDNIPNATLSAFKSTIAEAIDADLTLLLLDTSDPLPELQRKLETTRREVLERQEIEPDLLEEQRSPLVVLTKIDKVTGPQYRAVVDRLDLLGFHDHVPVSSMTGEGMEALQHVIRERLFGHPVLVHIHPPTPTSPDASERIVSEVYAHGMVEEDVRSEVGLMTLKVWIATSKQAQLLDRWKGRIDIK